jgi:hypothetical protein
MRKLLILAAALTVPVMAHAQVGGGDPFDGVPRPQDIRPMGVQMGYGGGGALMVGKEPDRRCLQGCIVVINRASTFDLTELYINDGKHNKRGEPVWGNNQMHGTKLYGGKAVWTPKPYDMKCTLEVRAVLRRHNAREQVEGVYPVDLCAMTKDGFAVINLRVSEPQVIIENGP